MKHLVRMALLVLACSAGALGAQEEGISRVMGAIRVEAGQHTGNVATVNGSVNIGENAVVGRASTVNGSVSLAPGAHAASVSSVNGAIHLGAHGQVEGSIHTVNGALQLEEGSDVGGDLQNVNGNIQVKASHIGGGIETLNGSIELGPDAHVDGTVTVDHSSCGWIQALFGCDGSFSPVPHIIIGPGCVVRGTLRFKREVRLYVSDRAQIGPVEGATIQRFKGDSPPL